MSAGLLSNVFTADAVPVVDRWGGLRRHREAVVVLLLALAALLLRVMVARSIMVIETDGVRYVEIARQFEATGSPFDLLFHPLYPICIAVAHRLVSDWELAGRLVSAVFGAALILPAYALVRAVLDRRIAAITCALLAVHPVLVRNSASVLSEATYTFLLTAGLWMAWHGLTGAGGRWLAGAGAAFGLAYLVRPEATVYLAGMLMAAVVLARGRGRRARLAWTAGSALAFAVIAAPYLVYLRGLAGGWTLSGKIAHNAGLDWSGGASAHAVRLLDNVFLLGKYGIPDLFPAALVLFLLPGLLYGIRNPRWWSRQGFLLAAAVPALVTLLFHVESRVFLPTLPVLLPFVAIGMVATAMGLSRGDTDGRWLAGLVALTIATVIPYTLLPVVRPQPGEAIYRRAAQWVAATQSAGATIMDRKPFVAFYSGRPFAPLMRVGPDDLARAARDAGARLVVLDSRALDDRPLLIPLLYGTPPPGLSVARDFDSQDAARLRMLWLDLDGGDGLHGGPEMAPKPLGPRSSDPRSTGPRSSDPWSADARSSDPWSADARSPDARSFGARSSAGLWPGAQP